MVRWISQNPDISPQNPIKWVERKSIELIFRTIHFVHFTRFFPPLFSWHLSTLKLSLTYIYYIYLFFLYIYFQGEMWSRRDLVSRGQGFVRVPLVKYTKICLMFIYGCSLIVWINCAVRSRASDMFTVHRMARLRSTRTPWSVTGAEFYMSTDLLVTCWLNVWKLRCPLLAIGLGLTFWVWAVGLPDQLCAVSGRRTGLNRFT